MVINVDIKPMKRILFTIALSLLFSFQLSAQNKESIFKGDLHYYLYYTDSTKLELENFNVWYQPKLYKKVDGTRFEIHDKKGCRERYLLAE